MGGKLEKLREINKGASEEIKVKALEKYYLAKADRRFIAIELLNLFLVMIVIMSIVFFLMPEKDFVREGMSFFYSSEVVDEQLSQLPRPPLSYLLFAIVLAGSFWIYNMSSWFRKTGETEQSRRILALRFALVLMIFLSIAFYFDPAINIIPPPYSYLVFGLLLLGLIALFLYVRFWREQSEAKGSKPKAKA